MEWLIAGLLLGMVGVVLHHILRLGPSGKALSGGLVPLGGELDAIYNPIAQEIETQATILGITLNDAFAERGANRQEIAWHVVRLAVGEWGRLTELVIGLQNTLARHVPNTSVLVPVRKVSSDHFKSRTLTDYIRLYEFLDQVLFSSKLRFSLQVRMLLRACTLLTKELRLTCREGELALDSSREVWNRLDYYFHDFDLIAKETLLAFRALLACQPPEGVQVMAEDLRTLLEKGVRVSIPATEQ